MAEPKAAVAASPPDSISTYRTLTAYAIASISRGIGWALAAVGAAFVLSFVVRHFSLGPLDRIRDWTDGSTLGLAHALGWSHPVLVSAAALVLGLAILLVQQALCAGLRFLERRVRGEGRRAGSAAAKPVTDYGPGRLSEEEVRRIKEKMLKSYGEEARPETIAFVASAPDSERKREELLKQFWQIEEALKSSTRKRCTFLSADVVGSTQMKNEQSEAAVKATFHAYEMMLKKIFSDYSAWKEAWTPDGVMICFLDHDLAAGAARRLLENLPRFNEKFNKLSVPFHVRCGINEGELSIYEDSALERVADKVIDVAGHMQKHAPPDTLLLADHVHDALADRSGFARSELVVDGYATWEWRAA